MDFKEIKALDDLYYNFHKYMIHVVNGHVGSSYCSLTEVSSESFVTKRLEEIKKAAMEYDLKLIEDYMRVKAGGFEFWFDVKVPIIKEPKNIRDRLDTYIEEVKSNYSFGKYPKLNNPHEIGYYSYLKQLLNYTRKLNELYEETVNNYNKKEKLLEKSPYEATVNEIKGLLR